MLLNTVNVLAVKEFDTDLLHEAALVSDRMTGTGLRGLATRAGGGR